jgi:hypothetical protein
MINHALSSSKQRGNFSERTSSMRCSTVTSRDSHSFRDSKSSLPEGYASSRTSVGSSLSYSLQQTNKTGNWHDPVTLQQLSRPPNSLISLRHARKKENLRSEFQSLLDEESDNALSRTSMSNILSSSNVDDQPTPQSSSDLENCSCPPSPEMPLNGSSYDDPSDRQSTLQVDGYEQVAPALDPDRQALVDRVMEKFWSVFDPRWASNATHHTAGATSASGSAGRSTTSSGTESSNVNHRKRQRLEDEGNSDDKNDENRQSRQPLIPGSDLQYGSRFACPFRKHDPYTYSIYSNRVCALSSWGTIARVKYDSLKDIKILD